MEVLDRLLCECRAGRWNGDRHQEAQGVAQEWGLDYWWSWDCDFMDLAECLSEMRGEFAARNPSL